MRIDARRVLCALVATTLVAVAAPFTASAQTPGGDELGICDPIDPSRCLFPFPNDYFTVPANTATGRRVDLSIAAMPRTIFGKPIDPTEWNRNDGFSPGAMMLAHVPGLDLSQTNAPPITDIARALDPATDIAVINAATGERHPFWAELDANATANSDRALILRPAVNLEEGARYVVALGRMRNSAGEDIPPSDAFRAYRDGTAPDANGRKAHMEELFALAEGAGIPRGELFLAWDFTVASERNLAERMLHIRDDAFGNYLGDESPGAREKRGHPGGAAPSFTVDRIQNNVDDRIARQIFGTFTVPNYMTETTACSWATKDVQDELNCTPTVGARFNYVGATTAEGEPCTILDHGCLPEQNGTLTAPYICNVPRAALSDGSDPNAQVDAARASLYGHGLFGGAEEINQSQLRSFGNEHNFVFCATDWMGMAFEDLPNVVTILPDMSNFPTLADRVQQGMLNFLFLGRLMIHPDGFVSHAAFQGPPKGKGKGPVRPRPVIDTSDLFYDGNSQGGIIGGALTAVAQDFTRAVLGVPGMNYSTLLNRSVDYEGSFSVPTYAAYPSKMDQQLIFALIQMLWDRAEANGYAHHMTDDPYANTPAHKVLLHPAFGDHQVANVAAEVEARTIGAHVYEPALMAGRHTDVDPYWGLPVISSDPALFGGVGLPADVSAFVIWDNCPIHDVSTCRTGIPPTTNTPPREGEDPHEYPRRMVNSRLQKATFLQTGGYIMDVCGGLPCLAFDE